MGPTVIFNSWHSNFLAIKKSPGLRAFVSVHSKMSDYFKKYAGVIQKFAGVIGLIQVPRSNSNSHYK